MPTYIALLRGINVSGHKKIKMVVLKALFEELGFSAVRTYIQSGNVVFSSEQKETDKLEGAICSEIKNTFGFDVSVLVLAAHQLKTIIAANPFLESEAFRDNYMFYVFLSELPENQWVEKFEVEKYETEKCIVLGSCAYLLCLNGMGKAKLSTNVIEKKLKVTATARNHRTTLKLLQMVEEE